MSELEEHIEKAMAALRRDGLERFPIEITSRAPVTVVAGGRSLVNFSSNDYLCLAHDRRVRAAFAKAALEMPASSTASRLICGDSEPLRLLETRLARLKNRPACLVFPSGYHANLGAITALAGEGDYILSDRKNHASIIDACRLCRARVLIFEHNDVASLEKRLARLPSDAFKLVIVESVYSTDGSVAPLEEIFESCRRCGATLMADEAHATGTMGRGGRGLEEHLRLGNACDVVMGTLGKALGTHGGFICGSRDLIHFLNNRARTAVYTTALPAAVAAAAAEAVGILLEEGEELVAELRARVEFLAARLAEAGLLEGVPQSPIIPIEIGDETRCVRLRDALMERGFFVGALRYPTVEAGKASLRLSVCRLHTDEQLVGLGDALRSLLD